MIPFDPADPFPFRPEPDYESEKAHAALVDAWLGLRFNALEARIARRDEPSQEHETWRGLPIQTLQTPYVEIRRVLELLRREVGEFRSFVDLGAAYGRVGLVLARHFPEVAFTGFECVPERVVEGQRILELLEAGRARLVPQDLQDPGFRLPEADVYFLYDYGSASAIRATLGQLAEIARGRAVALVGRGRRCRDLIERECAWLTQIREPLHGGNYTLYRNR